MIYKLWTTIRHNGSRYPMQSHYVGDIQLYILMWAVNYLNWNEMCRLHQTVHNYLDGIVTLLGGWKTNNEVHADFFPFPTWNRQWLE